MRLVQYEDEDGKLFQSWITENMSLSEAEKGLPHNPPDLSRLDCDAVWREINNLLIKQSIITLKDVGDNNNVLSNTILGAILPKLIELYKEQPGYTKASQNGHLQTN